MQNIEMFTEKVFKNVIEMSFKTQVGHIPSALSMLDYISVLFYSEFLNLEKDKIVLGKPFGAQTYYSVFMECGLIENNPNLYCSGKEDWSYCIGRENPNITFIDDTLGNVISVACGIAYVNPNTIYINVGDAYLQAGTAWEAIMFAGHHSLKNILITVDYNSMQVLGSISEIVNLNYLKERMELAGWFVLACDGHNLTEIKSMFDVYFNNPKKPTMIIFYTKKGYRIPEMENNASYHYKPLTKSLYDNLVMKNNYLNEK